MKRNVGGIDRSARLVVGPVLVVVGAALALGLFDLGVVGTAAVVLTDLLLVVGAVFVVTGATQKCPANEIAGLDTYEE